MRMIDRMMDACISGKPWDLARASYAYSRAAGLTVWQAFKGAVELYRDKKQETRQHEW